MSSTPLAPGLNPAPAADLYKHWTPETLRFSDLDRMRHVNNVSTISLYEDGWLRFVDDGEMAVANNIAWRVDYMGIDFRKQLHYRDGLLVGTRLAGVNNGCLRVSHILLRDGAPVGVAERLVTAIDRRTGRPVDVPAHILSEALSAAEPDMRAPFMASNKTDWAREFEPKDTYRVWRDDIFRFADMDADERIGRLTQLKLVESGRVGLIQDIGPPTADLNIIWMAAHVSLNFLTWPDLRSSARTGLRIEGFGNSSCHIRHTIFSEGRMIATGGAVVALANRKTLKSVQIPAPLRALLENAPDSNVPPSERYDPAKMFRDQTQG